MFVGRRVAVVLLVCMALFGFSVMAQEEPEPGKDHPSIPRFSGMRMIEDSRATDFDGFDFPIGEGNTQRVEGRSWHLVYELKEGARKPSPLEILRNYANQFKARGGRVFFQNANPYEGETTMVMPLGAGERWLHLRATYEGAQYTMDVIEMAGMEQKLEFSADQMAEQLATTGRVVLHGIMFDTGKAEIKPESNALLDEVAKMLKGNEGVKLAIEGHTDNVGQKAANLELSRRRASAVKAALVARSVAGERLTTEGYGESKAVADNSIEEGRTKNRRVELVKN